MNLKEIDHYFWHRAPGFFVDEKTGKEVNPHPGFEGTISDWYHTLVELLAKASSSIPNANKIIAPWNGMLLLECSKAYRPLENPGYTESDPELGLPEGTILNFPVFRVSNRLMDENGNSLIYVASDIEYAKITLLGFK